MTQSARCPHCRDLFVPERGALPTHFLDTHEGAPMCPGSGRVVHVLLGLNTIIGVPR